jgi:ribonuclease R
VVAGVTSFGLFVELVQNRVSGLVHVTQLPNDYYHFDPKKHLLSGERRGLRFRLGDRVRVLVLRASLEDRKIDFRLVTADGGPTSADMRGPARDGQRPARRDPDAARTAPSGSARGNGGKGGKGGNDRKRRR